MSMMYKVIGDKIIFYNYIENDYILEEYNFFHGKLLAKPEEYKDYDDISFNMLTFLYSKEFEVYFSIKTITSFAGVFKDKIFFIKDGFDLIEDMSHYSSNFKIEIVLKKNDLAKFKILFPLDYKI